ncbi:MAG: GrpB family protein [Planctomycetota bacterium]
MKRRIEVVAYDPGWPGLFKAEAAVLAEVFGAALAAIHHVGSTAVPGLAAKPTIDILCEVKAGTDIPAYYPAMARLGYECRGECLDAVIPGTPGRHYFPKVVDARHLIHVHVCHQGHPQVAELLGLRDYLRAHPDEAQVYGAHKVRLAAQFTLDNIAYMRGKDAFVKNLIARARQAQAR